MVFVHPGVFLFMTGLVPMVLVEGLYMQCILSTRARDPFVPCGRNHTITTHAGYHLGMLDGELTTQCDQGDKFSNKNKNHFKDGVLCCLKLKNCLLHEFAQYIITTKKNVVMECTVPSKCNIKEKLRWMKTEPCSMDKCTFRKANIIEYQLSVLLKDADYFKMIHQRDFEE
ncbi:hypothetical protein XELAEV_18045782mg [Xenopus laevis]|uniref:Uncharacterized protein n=1 Tax=Xenopus laevis TaxID=8355 RepID=A0A974H4Z8_XENLA|nr:hypothetical protein XELAEV_18045782mg [Xenopus laevis]